MIDDTPKGAHEEWAETEAKFCDLMVETMLKSAQDWQKPVSTYGADASFKAAECMLLARAWEQMASNLRKPRRCRIEQEQLP